MIKTNTHNTIIKRNSKWGKIYGKNNRMLYNGHILNNKPCGIGTTYYINGKKHLEGIFDIKGFVEGKEYYYNGQLRFEGKCNICTGYGPNYPIEGKYYDEDGQLLYSGRFKIKKIGNLGFPRIEYPKNFGGILQDPEITYLNEYDIKEVEENSQKIKTFKQENYPISYEQYYEKMINIFLEKEWNYYYHFTYKEKKEFIDSHNLDLQKYYKHECYKYDKNEENLFEKPDKIKNYPITDLLFKCAVYHITKELPDDSKYVEDINQTMYPLNYNQFKEKMIYLLINEAKKISKISWNNIIKDLKVFFKEKPSYISHEYKECCKNHIFNDEALKAGPVYHWGMWLDYWFIL